MRGRPTCPTGQKKYSVGATAGSPLFLLLQGKAGYRIAPSRLRNHASQPAQPVGGLGEVVSQTGRVLPTPKAFPSGGRWAGEAGSDEGAILYPPFLVEKGGSPGRRLNEVFLLLRWATRLPPHPSPSVTASPQVNSE